MSLWNQCLERLRQELPTQQFSMWIRPLVCEEQEGVVALYAPNRFVLDWVRDKYLNNITALLKEFAGNDAPQLRLEVMNRHSVNRGQTPMGTSGSAAASSAPNNQLSKPITPSGGQGYQGYNTGNQSAQSGSNGQHPSSYSPMPNNGMPPTAGNTGGQGQNNNFSQSSSYSQNTDQNDRATQHPDRNGYNAYADQAPRSSTPPKVIPIPEAMKHKSNINPTYQFDNFVEGKSNQLARAAATQVANNPGGSYNPLFIYGGTGLGKTHLLHAVGNGIVANNGDAKIVYMHSERFVQDMVKALQNNAIEDFKRFYRSVDALLIDDIQFFANKERSQEEFFHTFNALLEGNQQIILTSDRYPKEIDGVEDRLKSRFGWGLTIAIEPPELETRVAILMRKAAENRIHLPNEVAFFIAKRLRSNVRELEGALNRVIANANFTGRPITIDFVREALRDLLAL